MEKIVRSWIIPGFLLTGLALGQTVLATSQEETQLKDAQIAIDQHANAWSSDDHIQSSAKYFKVPVTVVQDLSTKAPGWGAVTIELAMAYELSKANSKEFPFMTSSVDRVEALRKEGQSWGEMAKTLKIGLAPVIQDAQDTANGLREDDLAIAQKSLDTANLEASRRVIREERRTAQGDREARRP